MILYNARRSKTMYSTRLAVTAQLAFHMEEWMLCHATRATQNSQKQHRTVDGTLKLKDRWLASTATAVEIT